MLPRTSLGSLGIIVGLIITIGGFIAYGLDYATLNLIGFFYGIPILLGGMALKAAELKPVPIEPPTPDDIVALREKQATDTLNQVRKDVCRYRYGQSAHLDTALEFLGLSPTDEERPELSQLREENRNGAYTLVLVFYSPLIKMETWQKKQPKMETFFGPGVSVDITEHPTYEDVVEAALMVAG
ncbi:DUF2854 domain-containing protein [Okeania sp. SIO2G5]|uniref:DUF2854 domain-containing protein n=1 Tax=Okeania sp. SIO2G5 TaxID=2607796 RepID=UPI0013C208E2|nr:DUF2854 domain-containing protein [Okeania sp. SIO2G5]NEP76333.1 DUF2854 domain-containing protein [Okeania sp. SIO2G5]